MKKKKFDFNGKLTFLIIIILFAFLPFVNRIVDRQYTDRAKAKNLSNPTYCMGACITITPGDNSGLKAPGTDFNGKQYSKTVNIGLQYGSYHHPHHHLNHKGLLEFLLELIKFLLLILFNMLKTANIVPAPIAPVAPGVPTVVVIPPSNTIIPTKSPVPTITEILPTITPSIQPTVVPTIPAGDAADKLRKFFKEEMALISQRSSATDSAYFLDGIWKNKDNSCWECDMGAAVGGAIQQRDANFNDPALVNMICQSVDKAIATYQQADGSYLDPKGQTTPIRTNFFLGEIATIYNELLPVLPEASKQKWLDSMKRAADYLIARKEPTWYTNGNINIYLALDFYLMGKITGDPKYMTLYQQQLDFVEKPGSKFPQAGFITTKPPTKEDGSDGKGYYTENNGLDWYYLEMQADNLAWLYAESKDPKVLRKLNLVTNQLFDRVNTSTWLLDTTGGTRHQAPATKVFMSPAVGILAWQGNRTDLQPFVEPQLDATIKAFQKDLVYSWWYGKLATQPGVLLQAVSSGY